MYVRGHLVHCPRPKTGEAPHRASPFIFFIKAAGLASTSTHAGSKPQRIALRTDFRLAQAAQ